jgi:hypothetical protein
LESTADTGPILTIYTIKNKKNKKLKITLNFRGIEVNKNSLYKTLPIPIEEKLSTLYNKWYGLARALTYLAGGIFVLHWP